jgi:hypothetical protein
VKAQAGVFPPETEEPRRVKAAAGVFPPTSEEPRRTRGQAGVFPPTTEEPRRVKAQAGVFPPETEEPRRTRGVASVSPITENPIPEWASETDVCSKKRSCDACTEGSYCKYTFSGKPQCCSKASTEEKVNLYTTSSE